MCLDIIKKFKPPVYGYKIFRINDANGKLFNIWQGNRVRAFPIGKVVNEKKYRTGYMKPQKFLMVDYPYGFHIFQSLKKAKNRFKNLGAIYQDPDYCIYKVEIIEPLITGQEVSNGGFCNVIISKKMKILEEV